MKLAEGATPPFAAQGDREAGFRPREKGTHSSRGIQATAPNAGVGETGGNKAAGDASPGTVDNCRGAQAAWERARDLDEGNALKGGSPGTVAA